MNNCPKIYVKVAKESGVIIPLCGVLDQSIDNAFLTKTVKERNIAGYNDYTHEFIKSAMTGEVYWSTSYDYDASKCTFNFYELHVCSGDDYIAITTESTKFNHKINYSIDEEITNCSTFLSELKKDHKCPSIETGFYIQENRWQILVRNILKHKNTMLVGPTGTGKTDVIIRICETLGIPCRIYDMGAMVDPLTDLIGSHRLENGSSRFDYAKFVQDVQEPGVILLDELSRAPQMTNNILFPCLDQRRTLPLEIADSNGPREVKVHPEVTFIATANIGSEYSGTSDIDAALENRFMTIQVDYLPISIESKILTIRTDCDAASADKILRVANTIRERYLEGSLSKTISTRETLNCAELVADGFSILDAISFAFCEKFPKYGDDSEYDIVKKILMGF